VRKKEREREKKRRKKGLEKSTLAEAYDVFLKKFEN